MINGHDASHQGCGQSDAFGGVAGGLSMVLVSMKCDRHMAIAYVLPTIHCRTMLPLLLLLLPSGCHQLDGVCVHSRQGHQR